MPSVKTREVWKDLLRWLSPGWWPKKKVTEGRYDDCSR